MAQCACAPPGAKCRAWCPCNIASPWSCYQGLSYTSFIFNVRWNISYTYLQNKQEWQIVIFGTLIMRNIFRMSSDVEEEMFYPRPAESDIESEAAAADFINSSTKAEPYSESVKDEPSDDCECMICYELLLDPVSLHCGHTFCQLCVAKLCYNNNNGVYATLQCPVCKKPCPTVSSVNIQLRWSIQTVWTLCVCVCVCVSVLCVCVGGNTCMNMCMFASVLCVVCHTCLFYGLCTSFVMQRFATF